MNILIIEDEKELSKEIETFLSRQGFTCDTSYTGKDASEKIFVNEYDFILLDLGLPDYEGLDLLHEIREQNKDSGIIIVTARGELDDRIKGLDLGADDYIAKPISLAELISRINAITRRKHGLKKMNLSVHGFEIDLQNRTISWQENTINLTKKEFDILNYLVLNRNRVLTRLQITEHIWGNILEDEYGSNYVDVHIKNIRKKLSVYSDTSWLITVRGIGYKLVL